MLFLLQPREAPQILSEMIVGAAWFDGDKSRCLLVTQGLVYIYIGTQVLWYLGVCLVVVYRALSWPLAQSGVWCISITTQLLGHWRLFVEIVYSMCSFIPSEAEVVSYTRKINTREFQAPPLGYGWLEISCMSQIEKGEKQLLTSKEIPGICSRHRLSNRASNTGQPKQALYFILYPTSRFVRRVAWKRSVTVEVDVRSYGMHGTCTRTKKRATAIDVLTINDGKHVAFKEAKGQSI